MLWDQFGKGPRSSASRADSSRPIFVDELHDLPRQVQRGLAVIRDAQLDQQIRPAHHPQPDPAVAMDLLHDLGQADRGSPGSHRPGSGPRAERSAPARPRRWAFSRRPGRANLSRLIEPRLQASLGASGCSPQGLVASIVSRSGTGFAGPRFTRSMKPSPGSPVCQAAFHDALGTPREP